MTIHIEDEELINKFIQVIDECELARYSPSLNTGKMDVLYNEAVSVISKIEQKIRG